MDLIVGPSVRIADQPVGPSEADAKSELLLANGPMKFAPVGVRKDYLS